MHLTREMEAVPGVARAAAMMGTPANRTLLDEAGLLTDEGRAAAPTDLIVAVAADNEAAARAAEAAARAALTERPPAPGIGGRRLRTLSSALRRLPGANLALISVPGPWAGAEAMKALRAGLNVMLFSDNVPLETEIALKRFALDRDLLLMGPDCGTAIIDGIPLGFANAVPRGRIGIAAASGTGLQEVSCLIARLGEGISQAIGAGGRDLGEAVGGLTTTQALRLLARDPATTVIVIIGKPPAPTVAAGLAAEAARLSKPCVVHFISGSSTGGGPGVHGASSLEECARIAVALARHERPGRDEGDDDAEARRLAGEAARGLAPGQRFVRGVYAGGTLAWEAVSVVAGILSDVTPGVHGGGAGHRVVDTGEDVFTVGRPHPMIDGTVRREWILKEAADPTTAVLLFDVVLGYGAHPDPAGQLIPAIERARGEARAQGRGLIIVASVIGTDADPQPRAAQVAQLHAHGVLVMPSNARAARLAASIALARAHG
jgi:succinyl-CoA synthetase alpha subunit